MLEYIADPLGVSQLSSRSPAKLGAKRVGARREKRRMGKGSGVGGFVPLP